MKKLILLPFTVTAFCAHVEPLYTENLQPINVKVNNSEVINEFNKEQSRLIIEYQASDKGSYTTSVISKKNALERLSLIIRNPANTNVDPSTEAKEVISIFRWSLKSACMRAQKIAWVSLAELPQDPENNTHLALCATHSQSAYTTTPTHTNAYEKEIEPPRVFITKGPVQWLTIQHLLPKNIHGSSYAISIATPLDIFPSCTISLQELSATNTKTVRDVLLFQPDSNTPTVIPLDA